MTAEVGGLAAALAAAVLWAGATVLYARAGRLLRPITLNAVKGVFATLLFALTLWLTGVAFPDDLAAQPARTLALLAASGVIGIAVGDSFYFASVNVVGPRRVALLSLLATPLVVAASAVSLGETLRPAGWLGVALTIAGVAWVVAERPAARADEQAKDARAYAVGVAFGLLAAVGQAAGAVMNRAALVDAGDSLDPLTTALWRLGVATLALLPMVVAVRLFASPRPRPASEAHGTTALWATVAVAALMGTYGGIWLQQAAFANAQAGPVQTLLSTTPVWVLPLAALGGERVTRRAVLGALVAVAGVAVLLATR